MQLLVNCTQNESKVVTTIMDNDGPSRKVQDLIKNFSNQPIIRPKGILKNKSVAQPADATGSSDDEPYDVVQNPPQKFSYTAQNQEESKMEPRNVQLQIEKEHIGKYNEERDTEDTSSDEETSPEYVDFGQYLSIPEIVDETKNFLREEENYCQLLWDLIEVTLLIKTTFYWKLKSSDIVQEVNVSRGAKNYINSLETEKFDDIFDIFGRIDLVCTFQNNTFLPELKKCRNVVEIAKCFIKHKNLFNTYYEHYFKNQQNMIFIMNDNKDIFKAGRPQFVEYERILLKSLNERILAYNNFLEQMKNMLAADIDVTNFERAIQILANLIRLFSPRDENIRFLISEVVETERAYIGKLEKINKHIIPIIESSIKQQNKQKSIIGNVPLIYNQQLIFYKTLEQCLFTFDPNEVGTCFTQHSNEFMQYVKDQQMKDNLDAIDECREILEQQSERNIDFHAPLNRLYKYKILLQELRKSCVKGGVPCDKVEEAFNMITGIIFKMNGVAAINCIKDENLYLDEQGELILRDEFIVQTKKAKFDAMVFLFAKSIIFAEIATVGVAKNRRDVFIYRNHIIAKRLLVTVTPNSTTDFQVEFHRKPKNIVYVLKAKDEKSKNTWITALNNMLMNQFEQQRLKHSTN